MEYLLTLSLAVAIDLVMGEPPQVIHPVVWMGKLISFLARGGHRGRPAYQFIYGTVMAVLVAGLFTVAAYFLLQYLRDLNTVACVIVGAFLLKATFSLKGLRRAALKVKRRLDEDKLDEARHDLRALVGRDTQDLGKPLLVSAAVESVAESASDGIVAPLFYFLLFGVPGAVAYRAVNTLDSMVGYRGRYEYLGKISAWLDTIMNYIPARLTALSLVLAAFASGRDGRKAWGMARRDHARARSINGGWPMAAMAGALDVQLEKVGYHRLGDAGSPLTPEMINKSLSLMQAAAAAWFVVCFTVEVMRFVLAAQA